MLHKLYPYMYFFDRGFKKVFFRFSETLTNPHCQSICLPLRYSRVEKYDNPQPHSPRQRAWLSLLIFRNFVCLASGKD